ncbi:hypothetical protein [Amorphus sp. 3PC139-8]|uniref:hypothetical protein n=1 Tax=Amorphus sp. 3PC139-8 TaxID=2735676 RepID=UPI00345D146E
MLTPTLRRGVAFGAVAVFLAIGTASAQAQSNGNGRGGGPESVGAGSGGGGGDRIIVCTGCADPNSYLKDGKLHRGPVAAYPPPRRPNRPGRIPRTVSAEGCYQVRDVLPDGRTVIYRDCGTPVRATW